MPATTRSGREWAAAIERLLETPGTRVAPCDGDAGFARAFNELAERFDVLRASSLREEVLAEGLQAVSDTLLGIADGTFSHRAPRSQDGGPLDVLCFLVNATAEEVQSLVGQLQAERDRLRETRAQLHGAEREAALGRLAAGVAHEINQPLTVAMTLVEMLQTRTEGPDEKGAKWLALVGDAIGHIAQIVDSVRTFGRPTPFELRPTPAREPLARALRLVASTLRTAGIELEEACDPAPPDVRANGERLQQVFINLLVNARDALVEADARRPRIRVELRTFPTHVRYRIVDNGPGVAASDRERLFEPFFTTKGTGGTGLGLSVSRAIVHEHGGRIRCEEGSGGGTAFCVTIPLAEAEACPE